MIRRGIFVVGTDTGIGKTFVSGALMAASERTRYWKPLQTGPLEDHDTPWVKTHAQLSESRVFDEGYRFAEPASPHHAAALEGAEIDLDWLCARPNGASEEPWVVEGVGGLMVPIDTKYLLPELITRLNLPVVLVASTRLGGINHTLLTLAQLETLKLKAVGLILNGPTDESMRTALKAHSNIPVLGHVPEVSEPLPQAMQAAGRPLISHPILAELLT